MKMGGTRTSLPKKIFDFYKYKKEIARGKRNLKEKGVELLDTFFEACDAFGTPCWLEFGTLLGAYRENSFIKHDFDIDCGIFLKDFTIDFVIHLMNYGFSLIKAFYLEDNTENIKTLVEVAFEYKGMKLDVFLSRETDDNERIFYSSIFSKGEFSDVYEYIAESPLPLCDMIIDGHVFKGPFSSKQYLENIYGPTFMIPDPKWVAGGYTNKCTICLSRDRYKIDGVFYNFAHKVILK